MGAVLGLVGLLFGAFNFFGGIVAIVWLLFLGEWRPLLAGLGALAVAPFILSLLVLPGVVFGGPAIKLLEQRHPILAFPLVVLSHLYTHAVVTAWALAVFVTATGKLRFADAEFWPMLLWSYAVAVGPWSYLAAKESQSGGGEGAVITVFFAQLAYVAMVAAGLIYSIQLFDLIMIFSAVMLVSVALQTLIAMTATSEWQSGTPVR